MLNHKNIVPKTLKNLKNMIQNTLEDNIMDKVY